jgi:predicted small lipoprotein YifL
MAVPFDFRIAMTNNNAGRMVEMSGISPAMSGESGSHALIRFLLVASLCMAVTGCGRRGAPEPPPSASVVTTDEYGNVVEKPADKVDRPFILDPLIQ